jgi:phage terminase small subunit
MSETVKLTDKQRVFIEEYLKCWNASEAARRAGYSEKTAPFIGAENLKKPQIAEAIKKRISEVAMSADEVLLRLAEQARAEQSRFWKCDFGEKVYVDMNALIEAGYAHLIKSFTRDALTGKITKVEFYDSQAALKLMGQHHKLFSDDVVHSGEVNVVVSVLRGVSMEEL